MTTLAEPVAGLASPPDEVLARLGVSARVLVDVFVLGRRDDVRERLVGRVEVVAGPGDLLAEALREGDLLLRTVPGEPISLVSVLVSGELHERAAAESAGWELEGGLPGRYAWVVESGAVPHAREDRFARRVCDRRGYLGNDQAVVRPVEVAAPPAEWLPPLPGPPASPAAAPAVTFHLLVDGDRDGRVDSAPGTSAAWTFGPSGRGAVVLVNNNDDGIGGRPDNEDSTVDAGHDVDDLAPLRITRSGTGSVSAGTALDLVVDRPDSIRIFSSRAAGATELVGPTAGASHRFATLPAAPLDLAMEGVRYAGRGFDGEVRITLRTTDPGGSRTEQTAVVRVAPWIMLSHLAPAEKVYVVNDTAVGNARFRTDLRAMVTAAGAQLVEFPSDDVWMQDCMEFGFACIPRVVLRTVLRSPRNGFRALLGFPRTLLNADIGYTEQGSVALPTTFNSSGNLEVTPPFTAPNGKRFPFGRIYFGPGRLRFDLRRLALDFEPLDADLVEFLDKQVVQAPIRLDTSWLAVGHVDEVLSFVPAPGARGFKMLVASPRRAYAILDALNATNPTDKLLHGRMFPDPVGGSLAVNVEQTISSFLGLQTDFHPRLHHRIATGAASHVPEPLRDYNTARQADIDRIRQTMASELGLRDSDIVEIPAILMPNAMAPEVADALIPGMVNMLVVNRHCIVPKPFGPRVGHPPVDRFEQAVRADLTALGLTVHFIDCWDEYHVALGEVHCATNTLRRPGPSRWWEFQP